MDNSTPKGPNPFADLTPTPDTTSASAPPTAPRSTAPKFDPKDNPFADLTPAPAAPENDQRPTLSDVGGEFLKGTVTGLPHMAGALIQAGERGRNMGVALPGADIIAGMLQPAIAPILGQGTAPTPASDAFLKEAGDLASKAHVNVDDYFPEPKTPIGRIARMAGEGAVSLFVPGLGEEAGLAKLGTLAKEIFAGTIGGGLSQTAVELTPDERYKPLAGLAGGLGGGLAGMGAAEAVGAIPHAAGAAADYIRPAIPGQERAVAARKLASFAENPDAALEGLATRPHEIVPGSKPTGPEVSGDRGLLQMQRTMARADPEFNQSLLSRLDQQDAARVAAMENLASPENPVAVADYFRARMRDLENRADQLYADAETTARGASDQIGATPAAEVGARAREAVEANFKRLNGAASQLHDAIDPNKDLHVAERPLQVAAARIYGAMSPEEEATLAPAERRIAGLIGNYDGPVPFQRFRQLRSLITAAMREVKSPLQPNGQAYRRLTQLRGAVEDAVAESIAKRVADDQRAVQAGEVSPDETLAANFLRRAKDWNAGQAQEAGVGAGAGNGVPAAPSEAAVPRAGGAEGAPAGGPTGAPGAEGLPQDAGTERQINGVTTEFDDPVQARVHDLGEKLLALNGVTPETAMTAPFPRNVRLGENEAEARALMQEIGPYMDPPINNPGEMGRAAMEIAAQNADAVQGKTSARALSVIDAERHAEWQQALRDRAKLERRPANADLGREGVVNAEGNDGAGGVRPLSRDAARSEGNGGGEGREADGSLRGLPRKPGPGITASAYPEGQRVAQEYMRKAGLDYQPPNTYAKVVPERAKRIADAYDAMPHDPHNPAVKRAYAAMVDETKAQYQAMLDNGMKIEFIPPGAPDPYKGNPRNMTEDVRNNKHMWVFSTKDGFGSDATFDPVDNPLLADSGYTISGQPALMNDIFRAVHDYFGHVKEGVGFRADGEENAWRAHSAMYSPEARKAMTTETRGQNSWVNYGPYGETNRTARSEDTHYADQKIGILPDWAVHEGAGDPSDANTIAERFASAGRPLEEGRALGALTDAFRKTMGVDAPLPEVASGAQAPSGALYQSRDEYHPLSAFADYGTLRPAGYHPPSYDHIIEQLQPLIRDAIARADGKPSQVALMIDNERDLHDRAMALAKSVGRTDENINDIGLGNMMVASAYKIAPDEGMWRAHVGQPPVVVPAARPERPTVPTFYSAAHKAVVDSKNAKATPDQWLATIKNTPGVKAEELEWLGLEPWMRSLQKGSISKEEIEKYINDNQLQVEETDLSGRQVDEESLGRIEWEPMSYEDYYWGGDDGDTEPGSWAHDLAKEQVAKRRNEDREDGEEELSPEDIDDDDPEVTQRAEENAREDYERDPQYTATVTVGGLNFQITRDRFGDGTEIFDTTNRQNVTDGPEYRIRDDADIASAINKYLIENGHSEGSDGGTKFHEYADLSGEDYHELLLKLPERADPNDIPPSKTVQNKYADEWGRMAADLRNVNDRLARLPAGQERDAANAEYQRVSDQLNALHKRMVDETVEQNPARVGKNFNRSHWDDPNVVAHIRFDTRNVGGKRTLFLQEIQSDWHQQGNERGYAGPDADAKHKSAQERLEKARVPWLALERAHIEKYLPEGSKVEEFIASDGSADTYRLHRALKRQMEDAISAWSGDDIGSPEGQRARQAIERLQSEEKATKKLLDSPESQEYRNALNEIETTDPRYAVPDAPFKTSWKELSIKRMIRWAAEHGYDQIAWTPGDLQNGEIVTRALDRVEYAKRDDGTYVTRGKGNGYDIGDLYRDGLPEDQLDTLFGKKIADQIRAGEGTQIGDRGGFPAKSITLPENNRFGGDIQYSYGKALPSLVSKMVKKFGVEIGRAPMTLQGERLSVITVPINDKMRHSALHVGQPLFQNGQRGAINFGRDGKALITLLQNADASTGVHELAHQFLQWYGDAASAPDAKPSLRADWDTTKNWWRSNAADVARDAGANITPRHVRDVIDHGTTGNDLTDAAVHRGMHEQWARAFEQYMRDGKAPTPGLRQVFERFKSWLGQVYRNLTGLNVKLSPEMRGVFDRMLGGEPLPEGAPKASPKMMDEGAAQRFAKATAATREIKDTFGAEPINRMMQRPGSTYPYNMPDEKVANALWRPGAEGATAIKNVLKAAGNSADARRAIEDAAALSVKRSATKDGLIDPKALEAWSAKHADALREMPGLAAKFATAAKASETLARIGKARVDARRAVEKTAVGKLLKLDNDADVVSAVGSVVRGRNSVGAMRELVSAAKRDPAALGGLRSAVVQHMLNQLKSSKDTLTNATFQRYLGRHAGALHEVLTPDQMNGLRAIAQDLKRASKETRAPGGGSDTAQNLASFKRYMGGSLMSMIVKRALSIAATSTGLGAVGFMLHPIAGAVSFGGSVLVQAAREAGLERVQDLLREAVLNPDLMEALLKEAPKKPNKGSAITLAHRLGQVAFFGGLSGEKQTK